MTLRELLKAKDDAEEHAGLRTEAHALAREALADAELALADAGRALADAEAARQAAHRAISDRLRERGHHQLTDPDGTVRVLHHAEPTEDKPNGWAAYHPVPGDEA